jgi:hypothetical protein
VEEEEELLVSRTVATIVSSCQNALCRRNRLRVPGSSGMRTINSSACHWGRALDLTERADRDY